MNTQALTKRTFHLAGTATLTRLGAWYDGNPLITQMLNAYTLLIPHGEHFIIRSCRRYLNRSTSEMKAELEGLFFQEGSHSREHGHVLETMRQEGLSLDAFRKFFDWFYYKLLEPMTPPRIRLATAAAIEHHNAVIATYFLNQNLLKGVRNAELRRLFLWHFAEEIEHQETVFKLLQSVSRSWFLRAIGLVLSFSTFRAYWWLGTLLLCLKTSSAFPWTSGLEQGLFSAILKESVRYLRPGFHPSVDESRPLLSSVLAELDPPAPRMLPPKFRAKMIRTSERSRHIQTRHKFFFNSIDGYDGAWVNSNGERRLNFCTYSYLGLLRHPSIDAAGRRALEQYGTGTHGVRLLGGNLRIHEQLEAGIASFFRREAAITFSSGFMTNLAVIGALVGKGDYILCDELNHASIVDGCRSSRAEVVRFRHSDLTDLASRMSVLPDDARKLIVVDAVYSMDGDIAPLRELIALRDRCCNTILMVDEAHSLGVLGSRGRGIEEHFNCHGQVDVLMGTLSKTIPCQGGYITGSHELITYLRYNARGFIFSAALSPVSAAAAHAALQVIEKEGEVRRGMLMSNVHHFIGRLRHEGFDLGNTETDIVPVLLGSEALAFEMARQCNSAGIYVMPVVYPAVPRGTERLRINVTCDHRREDLDYAVQALVRARKRSQFPPQG